MLDQNFGVKELYHVALKANTPMNLGDRLIEAGETVLYFDNITMSALSEDSKPIMARGGWGNMPHVIWEDRSEMTFAFTEGVINHTSFGILTSAKILGQGKRDVMLYLPKKDGPYELDDNSQFEVEYAPSKDKKMFCYEFERGLIQRKVEATADGKVITVKNGDKTKLYLLDYYFEYGDEAIRYVIEKERFNGTFTLEGKFYTKDENDGLNTTNVMIMPKVRVVSSIDLRLGERVDPSVSVFNVIAMPSKTKESNYELMRFIALGEDIDPDF